MESSSGPASEPDVEVLLAEYAVFHAEIERRTNLQWNAFALQFASASAIASVAISTVGNLALLMRGGLGWASPKRMAFEGIAALALLAMVAAAAISWLRHPPSGPANAEENHVPPCLHITFREPTSGGW